MVLDLSAGRLQDSILHAEKALESVEARLAELRNAANGQVKVETLQKPDSKGKGKAPARGPRLLGDDAVGTLTQTQVAAEIKELEGLKEDLALKVKSFLLKRHRCLLIILVARLRSSKPYRTSRDYLRQP